jgi:hypothetical protein
MKRKDYQEKTLIGSDTFEKTVKFLRMAFKEYQQTHPRWHNAFQSIRPPRCKNTIPRDALSEDEVIPCSLRGFHRYDGPGDLRCDVLVRASPR